MATKLKVLVACEFSGRVKDAFRDRGHDAWSCDLERSESPRFHLVGDIRQYLRDGWDMLIGFPPCTYLAVSGARWWSGRRAEQKAAVEFVKELWGAPIPKVALENPIGHLSSVFAKPTQIIQPWQFGQGETKATCLWLRGLPPLTPTKVVEGRVPRVHLEPPGPNRQRNRSRTYEGVATAMAEQWGGTNGH